MAEKRGLPVEAAIRVRQLVERFELPRLPTLEVDTLLRLIGRDKKVSEGGWRWILPMDIGVCEIVSDLTEGAVRQELGAFLARLEASS